MIRWMTMFGGIVDGVFTVGSDGFAVSLRLGSSSRKNLLVTQPSFWVRLSLTRVGISRSLTQNPDGNLRIQ